MSDHKFNPFARGTTKSLPPTVRDVFGRVLKQGDLILVQTGRIDPFRVQSITPVLDPSQPPNLVEVLVVSNMKFRCQAGQENQEFTLILAAAEMPPRNTVGNVEEGDAPQGAATTDTGGRTADSVTSSESVGSAREISPLKAVRPDEDPAS